MSLAQARPDFDFAYVRRLVMDRSAIVLDENKDYLVAARLTPIAEKEGFASLQDLVNRLRTEPSHSRLTKAVVEAMTTNETSFFRDMAPFDALRQHVLPDIIEKRQDRKIINLWCGASSSGQEPYSICITIKEHFPQLNDWRVGLTATDLSSEMVKRTKEGKYSQLEANRGLPARTLIKYFQRIGIHYKAKPTLKKMIDARELNLIERWPPLPRMDIVFLRNVLIYFDVPTKQAILKKVRDVMAKDGYLFLGGAETTLGIDDHFERVPFPNASCYKLVSQ